MTVNPTRMHKKDRVWASIIGGIVVIAFLANSCGSDTDSDGKPEPKPSKTATDPYSLPDYTGKSVVKADSDIYGLFDEVAVEPVLANATGANVMPTSSWEVCFQYPKVGTSLVTVLKKGITLSAVPKGTTCPKVDRKHIPGLPKVTGKTVAAARKAMLAAGVAKDDFEWLTAYSDDYRNPGASWKVCTQSPAAGESINTDGDTLDRVVSVGAVKAGENCPPEDGASHYKNPANDPDSPKHDGDDDGVPDEQEDDSDWDDSSGGTSTGGGSSSSGGSGGDGYDPGGCRPGGCDNSRHCPPGGCKN
ncbi:PASTA domain-containing protein [Streptomyces boluensis]|uniref:PASTA domain-containing protein n=1 Tax=Streptomyces boluensis TaxID=1775135 RepID=A0A964XQX8_9ACTN|nr:hypothetical protein [Streptomyces boluensis]NBE56242.1 hypothetical protein [Streptomyces boluensis]